jgi:hypothetical protein
MKTAIDMANETLDRMAPDDYCRTPYWTATDEELKAFADLVRADEREEFQRWFDAVEAQHKQMILAEKEACAKLIEAEKGMNPGWQKHLAAAIRNRGQAITLECQQENPP